LFGTGIGSEGVFGISPDGGFMGWFLFSFLSDSPLHPAMPKKSKATTSHFILVTSNARNATANGKGMVQNQVSSSSLTAVVLNHAPNLEILDGALI
jgi:hypothetical protein